MNYNREMIRLGRELAGFSRTELARRCGLNQATITRIENGDRTITHESANAIADAVGRPLSFFQWGGEVFAPSTVFHRRRASTRARDVAATRAFINFARLRVQRMLLRASLTTQRKMHRISLGPNCSPSDAARQLRAVWQVPEGPIANVVDLVESAGVVIWETNELSEKVDALSLWPVGEESLPVVVRVAGKPGDRERLTLAHELGHLCLHHMPSNDFETEANQFAAEFMMPEADIKKRLNDMDLPKAAALKQSWKVSMQALIRRSRDLGCISDAKYRRLMTELSAKGYRKREPVLIPSERPKLLEALVKRYSRQIDAKGLQSETLGYSHKAGEGVKAKEEGDSSQSQLDSGANSSDAKESVPNLRLFG